MELSSQHVKRLEEADHHQEEFAVLNDGLIQLRNVEGRCYFYSIAEKKCRIYEIRPLDAIWYPVVYLINEGATVDELCPRGQTNSENEFRKKRLESSSNF